MKEVKYKKKISFDHNRVDLVPRSHRFRSTLMFNFNPKYSRTDQK